ncbi:MAG TPA: hypothetical protein VD948_05410, partial [Rhodothermales bacterium]|nr:hypothetical protein [Rhodothermales bacterium]
MLLFGLVLAACGGEAPAGGAGGDTTAAVPTPLRVAVSETLIPAAERQTWYFAQRAPGVTSELLPRTARGAFVALFADSVHAIL